MPPTRPRSSGSPTCSRTTCSAAPSPHRRCCPPARPVEPARASLRTVMYELPLPSVGTRPRQVEPCPMSSREIDVLRRLAKGMVYKQIAGELGLSTSTIRTHLHNVYGKLGAMDRAQAVLIATERGWI